MSSRASKVPAMLNAVIDAVALDDKQRRSDRVFALAEVWGHKPSQIWRVAAGKGGLKPPLLWDLGWALRDCGVKWMSGPAALSFEPAYQGHLLGAVGEVLAPGPTTKTREWWDTLWPLCSPRAADILLAAITSQRTDQNPNYRDLELPENDDELPAFARKRILASHLEQITESRDSWTYAWDDSWESAPAQEREFVERGMVAAVTMSDELEHAFRQAWTRWWGAEKTEHLARPIRTLIEAARINISQHLYDRIYDELMSWFRLMDIPAVWDCHGEYMRWIPE